MTLDAQIEAIYQLAATGAITRTDARRLGVKAFRAHMNSRSAYYLNTPRGVGRPPRNGHDYDAHQN